MNQEQQPTIGVDVPCKANPDLWFATRDEAVKMAVLGCEQCPVMKTCRDYAISEDEPYGTWGGSTEKQREEARRIRNSPEGQAVQRLAAASREAAAA